MANYFLGDKFTITSPFGDTEGRKAPHNGLDLAAPAGTDIPALIGGKVTEVYIDNATAGNGITIMGADGREYRYIHMQNAPSLKVGDNVSSGMVIGKVGSTGQSSGPHLDLRVRENGKAVDPLPILKGYQASSLSNTSGGQPKTGGSSYTNTWKTKNEALKAPGYQAYKGHLQEAMARGGVPSGWVVALTELIGRESTWNPGADNGSSSAWGYGQFINSTRKNYEAKTGLNYNDPVNQIIMTAQYVKDVYGTPEAALQHWDSKKWY